MITRLFSTLFVTLSLVAPARVIAADALDWVQPAIDIAKSPEKEAQARVDAMALLTERWKDSLPILIQNIDAYYRADSDPAAEDVAGLLPLTDLAVTIVLNKDGAIEDFRQSDTDKTIKLLAWATRGPQTIEQNRNLRFNAAYILASVVDNSNLCIILDHLRDPELGPNGLVNLLQVAMGTARSAYKENAEATLATVDILRPRVAEGGPGKIAVLVESLGASAMLSPNAETPLPFDAQYCRGYDYEATPP
jgi:hypothetical protein